MVVLGYAVSVDEIQRGHDLSGDLTRALIPAGLPPSFQAEAILFPLAVFFNFAALVGAGLWWRHRPDIHKRLMLLAVIGLAREPILHLIGHLSGYWPTLQGLAGTMDPFVTTLLLSVSAIHDNVTQSRIHPVSLWVPTLMVAWRIVLGFVVSPSLAWRDFATWLIR